MTSDPFSIAIVGLGPRGHYALECLISALIEAKKTSGISIIGFEPTSCLGHGPVYDRNQLTSNWINITERVLDLPGRPAMQFGKVSIDSFPSYKQWAGLEFNTWPEERVDTFPPRSAFGDYLSKRFESLCAPLRNENVFTLVNDTVDKIVCEDKHWGVKTQSGEAYLVDDILLTIGHQPTRADAQLSKWMEQTRDIAELRLFSDAYPVERIIEAVQSESVCTVAIRGYGLATIDTVRALAEEFGSFSIPDEQTRAQTYSLAQGRKLEIAPFSLDGLCIGPKPITPLFDSNFAPTEAELQGLNDHLSNREAQSNAKDANFLINAMCPVIGRVFRDMSARQTDRDTDADTDTDTDTKAGTRIGTPPGSPTDPGEIEHLIRQWIEDVYVTHACILDATMPPVDMLGALTGMATGKLPVTLDYCIGQVWRQCQGIMYSALSHGALPDDVLAEIINVDEALKRYSYGPPVESLQQLIALHDAGVLNLDLLNDPVVDICNDGWTLRNAGSSFTTKVMVNAVVDAPDIEAVDSPLLASLLDEGLIEPVHDGLGITTGENGCVTTADGTSGVPVALLGRLAKGTVIGVDAILECFGERAQAWARSAAERA